MSGHRISRFVNRAFGPEIILRSVSGKRVDRELSANHHHHVNDHRRTLAGSRDGQFLPASFSLSFASRERERSVYIRVTREGEKKIDPRWSPGYLIGLEEDSWSGEKI